jgi:hypothetical protein
MDARKALELLKEQIKQIEGLKKPPAFNPNYRIWDNTTINIMDQVPTEWVNVNGFSIKNLATYKLRP